LALSFISITLFYWQIAPVHHLVEIGVGVTQLASILHIVSEFKGQRFELFSLTVGFFQGAKFGRSAVVSWRVAAA
jgi:hypothetical protein